MFGIDSIIDTGLKIIDKVVPDPKAKAEAKARLKELEQKGELRLEELNVQRLDIAKQDRQSARDMQEKTKSKAPPILAGIVIVAAFSVIIFVLTKDVSVSGEKGLLIGTIVGGVLGYVTQVLNYYFGSTAGSKTKDDTISGFMKK